MKKLQNQFRLSERSLSAILEKAADAIFVTNLDGEFIYTNESASDLLGYTAKEFQNMSIQDLVPPLKKVFDMDKIKQRSHQRETIL